VNVLVTVTGVVPFPLGVPVTVAVTVILDPELPGGTFTGLSVWQSAYPPLEVPPSPFALVVPPPGAGFVITKSAVN
jgi:hypothetical protein